MARFNNYKKHYRYDNHVPFIPGIAVVVKNGNTEAAIRKFKKKVQEEGIIKTVRDKQEYVKPSEKRRKAKAASRARWRKRVEKAIKP